MKIQRIKQLMQALDDENISYGEIAEIDSAAADAGIEQTEEMMVADVLIELEARA